MPLFERSPEIEIILCKKLSQQMFMSACHLFLFFSHLSFFSFLLIFLLSPFLSFFLSFSFLFFLFFVSFLFLSLSFLSSPYPFLFCFLCYSFSFSFAFCSLKALFECRTNRTNELDTFLTIKKKRFGTSVSAVSSGFGFPQGSENIHVCKLYIF